MKILSLMLSVLVAVPVVPAAADVPAMSWADCGDGFQCGALTVPLDYRRPSGETIDVSVIRLPARQRAGRIGTLLAQPGGPGNSGVDYVRANGSTLFKGLNERFDIVGMDPRGVARSSAVRCWAEAEYLAAFADSRLRPDGGSFSRVVAAGRSFDQACTRQSAALLPYVGTGYVARDIDMLRAAIGDRKLTVYGRSYGTYIATVYANLFPDRVRAMALDGGYDPIAYVHRPYAYDHGQFVAVDAALTRFLQWCADTPSQCAFGHGDPAGAFDRLTDRLDKNPVVTPNVTVNAVVVLYQVLLALNSGRAIWPTLGELLRLADDFAAGPLLSGDLPPDIFAFLTANTVVECADRAFPTDPRTLRAALAWHASAGPRFAPALAYGLPAYDQTHAPACTQWPVKSVSRYDGGFAAAGAAPILVIGTTGDPDTPYQDSVTLTHTLRDARLLTFTGEGHTAFGRSTCVTAAVTRYLIDEQLPAPATTCDDEPGSNAG